MDVCPGVLYGRRASGSGSGAGCTVFTVFRITALGVIFVIAAIILLVLLFWITWIRRQYAFGGGGMMEGVHQAVLSHLDYNGQGKLLDVGCGSGALSIRTLR